jgi:hypothetical protein
LKYCFPLILNRADRKAKLARIRWIKGASLLNEENKTSAIILILLNTFEHAEVTEESSAEEAGQQRCGNCTR